ncbi:Protein TIFY 8 [Platanthera zijinensis]|uniref:Protein TIFY n=1 Tax=Platanthera zijinensis TaxID=2320716 RepID=A0AAP0BRX3_9ASPA
MAVGMMGGDNKKLIFHDFLAMSCENLPATVAAAPAEAATTSEVEAEASASASASAGVSSIGHGLILGSGDPVSGKPALTNSEVFIIRGRKDNSPGPETSNSFSGRKRSNSDSTYVAFTNDKIRSVCADTPDCSRSLKKLGKEAISDWSEKYPKDKVQFQMQSPLQPTSVHSPLSSRPVLLPSKLEQSTPQNSCLVGHYSSRVAQSGIFSSYVSKDVNFGAVHMSQPAADEGSRTGIKGSGVLNTVASRSGPTERSMPSVLPSSNRPNSTQINEPYPSNPLRYHASENVGRQMTIFYAGQAHVFDDVHPNKAEVIMALAGSNGGSWSTTYLQKTDMFPSPGEVKVPNEDNIQRQISHPGRTTLTRDIQNLSPGGRPSGVIVRDGRAAIQAPLPSTQSKRDAS